MADDVPLDPSQHRLLIAMRYLNASEEIYKGLERQKGTNNFHFLVTLRSFIEYTRRGIWYLVWASDERIKQAEALTFKESGTPALMKMDEMFNEALGDGRISHLMAILPGINEPFLELFARTYSWQSNCGEIYCAQPARESVQC